MRTAADLFCGAAGAWALGLHWAGVHVVAACEADQARAAAYHQRWRVPVHPDVRTMRGEDLPADLWLLAGSPPCKGISEVNHKGQGVDDDGLFFEAIRIGAERRPPWIALENVDRLRSRGADRVLAGLEEIGYSPRTLRVGSDDAGKDHERKRVIIVASDAARRERWAAGQPRPGPEGSAAGRGHIPGPESRRDGVGHLGTEAIGRHLRAYDGVPDRVAEFARHAYGDALDPVFPWAIARALISWETPVEVADG